LCNHDGEHFVTHFVSIQLFYAYYADIIHYFTYTSTSTLTWTVWKIIKCNCVTEYAFGKLFDKFDKNIHSDEKQFAN